MSVNPPGPDRRSQVDELGQAESLFRSGRATEAEQAVESYLQRFPDNVRGWQLVADVARTRGRLAAAADAWQRIVRLRPDAESEFEVGRVLNELGRHDEAAAHLVHAVRDRVDWFEALTQLGIAQGSAGRAADAVSAFREAARVRPQAPQAHHNLGVALLQAGQPEDGIASLELALRLQPIYPEAHYNLGNGLAAVGRRAEAIESYRRALSQRPEYAEAYHNLGVNLNEAKREDEAVPYLQQAVRLRPDAADGHNNLGIALEALGRFEQAEAAYHAALRLDPRHADAHANLGNLNKARGRLVEALACYQVSLWLRPDSPSTWFNRSLVLLQKGDWNEGWVEYDWRLRKPGHVPRCSSDRPMWDGSPGNGRTILLWAEQGLGDTIQFCRYAALVKERGFRVLFHVPGILLNLMQSLQGAETLVAEGEPLPPHDVHCPLMSLPRLFRTTPESVPAETPYLKAHPSYVDKWRKRITALPGRKVGLYWQGNPHHPWDRHRSVRLEEFGAFRRIAGLSLVSLQQGPGREQLKEKTGSFEVVDLGPDFQTIDDLAGAIAHLDAVVSVDTSAAHLGGAMAKPTWLLLSEMADWRWLTRSLGTPWYPTVRLSRQKGLGRWDITLNELCLSLADASDLLLAGTDHSIHEKRGI